MDLDFLSAEHVAENVRGAKLMLRNTRLGDAPTGSETLNEMRYDPWYHQRYSVNVLILLVAGARFELATSGL